MPERKRNQLLARSAASTAMRLRRVWTPNGGNANGIEVGLILTEVFYTANPWASANYVAERLGFAYSTDTIRRRLEQMVYEERVEVVEVGGRKLYRACPSAAQATIDCHMIGAAEATNMNIS